MNIDWMAALQGAVMLVIGVLFAAGGLLLIMAATRIGAAAPHAPKQAWERGLPLQGRWLRYVLAQCVAMAAMGAMAAGAYLGIGGILLLAYQP